MSTDSKQTILSSLKHFLSGTLLSRFTGLLREVTMAFCFGVTPVVASFWMAFRFANLFRRLLGEGALNVAFIPHFELLRKNDPKKATSFFYNLTESLTWLLLILVIVCEIVLGSFLILYPMEKNTEEIVILTMILLPSLLFLSLYALNTALLNTQKKFFLPSAAPALVNIIWVGAALLLRNALPIDGMKYLAMIIVFAFAVQWLFTAIPTYSLLGRFSEESKNKKRELLTFLSPFLLVTIGVTAQQINSAVDAIFAKIADPEGPAILWYALRLQQLPFALIGVGLMNALLPPLSRAEDQQYGHLLNFSLKKIAIFMIPLTFAVLVGGFAGVNLLYGRGAFSEKATYETAVCLMAYGLALLPMAWTLLLASAFYAKKQYKVPTLISVLSIVINISLNAFFVYVLHMKAISIALATTISSFGNMALLSYALSKKGIDYKKGLFPSALKISLMSFAAFVVTAFVSSLWHDNTWNFFLNMPLHPFPRTIEKQLISAIATGALFLGALMGLAYLFKVNELISFGAIRSRKRPEY